MLHVAARRWVVGSKNQVMNAAAKARQHLPLPFGSAQQDPDRFFNALFTGGKIESTARGNSQGKFPADAEETPGEVAALSYG